MKGKGFWNQRWNVSQEKLFGVIIKKGGLFFALNFDWDLLLNLTLALFSIFEILDIKNYYILEEDVWTRFPETVNQNHAEQKSILDLKNVSQRDE